MAKSLDVLDSVIGEFDDGFLSDAESIRTASNINRKETRGQFSFGDKIDKIFDDAVYEESKVERLTNFEISSGDGDQVTAGGDSEIPAPGTVLQAKRQYLDNLDRDRSRSRARKLDTGYYSDYIIRRADKVKSSYFNRALY